MVLWRFANQEGDSLEVYYVLMLSVCSLSLRADYHGLGF